MQKIMLAKGVKADKIILETKSTNTKDHVKYLLPMAIDKGYKQIYLVTSASHMLRSMQLFKEAFRKNGIEVVPYPCGHRTSKEHELVENREWIPNIFSFELGVEAWTEYLGMLELKFK